MSIDLAGQNLTFEGLREFLTLFFHETLCPRCGPQESADLNSFSEALDLAGQTCLQMTQNRFMKEIQVGHCFFAKYQGEDVKDRIIFEKILI